MAKLGVTRSYLLVNTFLYSIYGQAAGEQHVDDAGIVDYRNAWLDAIFAHNDIDAVLALGHLADHSWHAWGKGGSVPYRHVTHPTQPESSSGGDPGRLRGAIAAMLENWNAALEALHPLAHADVAAALVPYGTTFAAGDRVEIPEGDVPPGLPDWMRSPHSWADRVGSTPAAKRRNITVTVPSGVIA